MRSQCISRPARTCSFPTTGMLFSAWQATTQALQPVQAVRSITMARHDPDRGADLPAIQIQLDDICLEAAVLAAVFVAARADAELLGRRRAHERGIIPRELGDRLGEFLKPAVVGKAAVVNRRVRLKDDLEMSLTRC